MITGSGVHIHSDPFQDCGEIHGDDLVDDTNRSPCFANDAGDDGTGNQYLRSRVKPQFENTL